MLVAASAFDTRNLIPSGTLLPTVFSVYTRFVPGASGVIPPVPRYILIASL